MFETACVQPVIFIVFSRPISACWSWIVVVDVFNTLEPPWKFTSVWKVNKPFLSTLNISSKAWSVFVGAFLILLFKTKLSVEESYFNSANAELFAVESVKPPCPKF